MPYDPIERWEWEGGAVALASGEEGVGAEREPADPDEEGDAGDGGCET